MTKEPVEIQLIRKHTGMSQSQFANAYHINISTLQMWEQGINRTPDSILFLIKRILELEGRPFVVQPELSKPEEAAVNG